MTTNFEHWIQSPEVKEKYNNPKYPSDFYDEDIMDMVPVITLECNVCPADNYCKMQPKVPGVSCADIWDSWCMQEYKDDQS